MCGIAGVAHTGDQRALPANARVLAHRGPDGGRSARWRTDSSAGVLGHDRLAIVDLSERGVQPMTDEHDRFLVAFNGEIYNHAELRSLCQARGHRLRSRMDGEVIVHLWEDEGEDCLRRLNGIFAVAVVDTVTGSVWLARDPVGVKPLYHIAERTALWFASEPRAIGELGADLGSPDVVALAQFLTFLWIPDPRTPFSRVRSVPPGHVLRWRPGHGARTSRYVAPLFPRPETRHVDVTTAVSELEQQLSAACERQLLGDVPVGLMASGGIDSSLLWWQAHQQLAGAYTIEWSRDAHGERLDEDAEAVRTLRNEFGSPATFIDGRTGEDAPIPASGDLFADPAYELTRLIAARARQDGRKVLWSGQGGDELLGGYRRHRVAWLLEDAFAGVLSTLRPVTRLLRAGGPKNEYATRLVRAASANGFFERYLHLCTYSDAKDRARVLGCTTAEVADETVWSRHREIYEALPSGLSALRKALALDLNVYLPGLGLGYVDRAGMEHGVEIRVPWLDLELVHWSLTLPDKVLAADGGKAPARALARKVLPQLIADRPKRGFAAPIDRVRRDGEATGSRGHRQGDYFARAAEIVHTLADTRRIA